MDATQASWIGWGYAKHTPERGRQARAYETGFWVLYAGLLVGVLVILVPLIFARNPSVWNWLVESPVRAVFTLLNVAFIAHLIPYFKLTWSDPILLEGPE